MAEYREDKAWLASRLTDPSTRIVVLQKGRALIRADDSGASLVMLQPEQWDQLGLQSDYCVFLGIADQRAVFAFSTGDVDAAEITARAGHRFASLRSVMSMLTSSEAGLAAYARAMNLWQLNHRFCGRCGSHTRADTSGFRMLCTNSDCALEHFPRLDPAIIVIIGYQGRCLLGRNSNWPKGVYSTLAGFVEPGESLEDAVHREVHEEAGVRLAGMHYHSSQPWPFPSSLMLGFVAEAASDKIRLGDELEDVRWFDVKQLEQGVMAGKLMLSSPISVSHRLIAHWLQTEHGVDMTEWQRESH